MQQSYIVSLDGMGLYLKSVLESQIRRDQSMSIQEYNTMIERIYQELLQQMVLPLDNDIASYPVKLRVLPDLKPFMDIVDFTDPSVIQIVSNAFQHVALAMAMSVHNRIEKMYPTAEFFRSEYLLQDLSNYDHLVLLRVTSSY